MRALGTAVIVLLFIGALVARAWLAMRRRREKREALGPGSLVLVRTPDRKTLLAKVQSRGPSHFWIELLPGDTRFWVPASAVKRVPKRTSLERDFVTSTLQPAPRPVLDSEI
jgi:hypothetical protein